MRQPLVWLRDSFHQGGKVELGLLGETRSVQSTAESAEQMG